MKHFKDEENFISFNYPDNYNENTTEEHKEMNIIASFENRTLLGLSSAFAVFNEKPISAIIPKSRFEDAIRDSGDTFSNIYRYNHNGNDIVIAKTIDEEYTDLSPNQSVLVILDDIGMSDDDVMRAMNLTNGALRTLRSRLRQRRLDGKTDS